MLLSTQALQAADPLRQQACTKTSCRFFVIPSFLVGLESGHPRKIFTERAAVQPPFAHLCTFSPWIMYHDCPNRPRYSERKKTARFLKDGKKEQTNERTKDRTKERKKIRGNNRNVYNISEFSQHLCSGFAPKMNFRKQPLTNAVILVHI